MVWTSKRVTEFLDVKYRTLDSWVRTGLLSCAYPGNGRGNQRGWSAGDVTRAVVVNELRAWGYSLQAIRRVGVVDKLTDGAIANGVIVCAAGNVIDVVPEFDPILEAKVKERVDGDRHTSPASVMQFLTSHLSRDFSLARQASVIIHVTKTYELVKNQMKEESEVQSEQS